MKFGTVLGNVLATLTVLVLCPGGASYAQDGAPGGWYYIQSKISGLFLDDYGAGKGIGNHIVQAAKHPDQVWKLIRAEAPGYYYIQSRVSGLYLDDYGAGKEIGNHIVQAAKHRDQVWKVIPAESPGYYYIESKISGLYLHVLDGSRDIGAHIIQDTKNSEQVWLLTPAVTFPIKVRSDKVFEDGGGADWIVQAIISNNGRIDMASNIKAHRSVNGWCGRFAVYVFDDAENVLGRYGMDESHSWCVNGRLNIGPHDRNDELHQVIPVEVMKKIESVAVLQVSAPTSKFSVDDAKKLMQMIVPSGQAK